MRWIIGIVVVAALGLAGWLGFQRMMEPVVTDFDDEVDQFHYGSIGNDGATGVPFAIWAVLPEVFPDLMPGDGGYADFGFLYDGRGPAPEVPIGFSRARVGVDRMAINCAFCHTTRVRTAPDAEPEIVVAGTSNTYDVQAYIRFLAAVAEDDRFTAANLVPAMAERGDIPWLERQLHRLLLVRMTRRELQQLGEDYAWMGGRTEWGPGRIEPFNPVKFTMLGLPVDDTIGVSDMMPVWNLDAREAIRADGALHWDGLSTSIPEVVLSSALGDGMVAEEYSPERLARIETFLRELPPPPSPFSPDPAAVARGAAAFAAECAECHAETGARVLTVIPLGEVGTDPERVAMWTDEARDAYQAYAEGRDWGFAHFQNAEGYLTAPLWGIWATGPYLHNGSVPTLADLLEPPEDRPVAFLRGPDVLDPDRGGFVAPACDPADPPPRSEGFCLDTRERGNGNGGHLWGTDLPDDVKADLVAYMLTL